MASELYFNGNPGQYSASAILSELDGSPLDGIIASAIQKVPFQAVSDIMPTIKLKGPTSQWIEPYYVDNTENAGVADKILAGAGEVKGFAQSNGKLRMLSTPIDTFRRESARNNLRLSCEALDKLVATYTEEGAVTTISNWMLFHKHSRQREVVVNLLNDLAATLTPVDTFAIPKAANAGSVEDTEILIQNSIHTAMMQLNRDLQINSKSFSIVAPFEASFAIMKMQSFLCTNCSEFKINVMYDERAKNIYVFNNSVEGLARSGMGLFEYTDTAQRVNDENTGAEQFIFYNRWDIAINPIHNSTPVIKMISLQ